MPLFFRANLLSNYKTQKLKNHKQQKNLVETQKQTLLYNMKNDDRSKLAYELSILYPDVTDIELNEITTNLINFYKIAVETVLEQENQETK